MIFHNVSCLIFNKEIMATFKVITLSGSLHQKADGTKNIKVRIYHNKSVQYISTAYYIEESYLDKSGTINTLYPHADVLNYELGDLIQKYRGVCIRLGTARLGLMSCTEIKEQIIAAMEPEYEFIDFISYSQKIIEKTKKEKTADWYQLSIDTLCWFYGRKKIDIRDITVNRLNEYMEKLSESGPSGKPLAPGAISNYMRGLRALFNKARKHFNNEDYDIIRVPNEPFKKISIPKYRRSRKNLSVQDIIRIRDGEFSTKRANMARDVFMIMFYLMGINVNDLYSRASIARGRVEYERSKTDTEDNEMFPLSIRIEPELHDLLEKYSSRGALSYFKSNYCDSYNFMKAVNKGLEIISKELNLGVKVTTNWARHSWATIARNKAGVPKADIDFCLGHVNNEHKMADIYIDIDYSIFDKSNRLVLNLLKK